ncbi:putative Ig domain-containing protein [Pectobacterium versatile]|uniref:Putative Ig domain-containing protein n=42 Tax=Pectobacterium TaxID=122277 RepID=A0A7T0ER21_9GAMM|nr:putative Ig domain-containing protein [Pectobacterium versatile]QPK16278.1 putative Ig domain-containing protein [Pectobacterium versatile]
MLWRQLFSKKSDNPTDHIEQDYSAPLGCVLESRVLFDGAIAATATQAETGNSSDATASSHPTQTANHSAEAASENNTSSDQNSATHDITTDVVVQAVAGEITRKEAVFIDTAVTDYQTLIGNVPAGVDVFLLDSSKDGLSQLATWAETHKGYDAIHILSHGSEGQVRLGNLTLDSATAVERSADLAKFGTALTQDGDLLLYGCDIAQDTGKSFVSLLAQLTQADIAASDDLTGATAKGGDWQLETTVGKIETTNAALGAIAQEYNSLLASPTYGTNDFSQFSGTTPFVNVQPGLQTYDDPNNGFTYVANSTGSVTIQTVSLSGNQVLNTIVTPGGNLNYFGFKSTDGSEFKLSSIDLRGLGNYASTFTITGYKDGSAVAGTTQTITLTTTFQTVTLSNAFQNIDEVRLTTAATGNGTVTWDNIVTAPLAASTDNVPSVTATGANPTYTENGTAVGLFTGVSVDTQDTGQTFTSAAFTVSNVAGSTEYLTLHGINVALSNGNSVSLGSGFGTASVSLSGSIATVSITGATLSNSDMGSLLSGMAYGNSSDNPGNATRTVTLTQLTDSGTSNNTVAPNISSAITVVPVNDAPTDITLSATTFAQSLGSNGTVATLTATDVDSSVFTYSLVSGSGSTDNALFTISGNTLKAVNATGMAAGTYSVRLQVSDGAATYDKVVSLVVVDDIAPTFDQSPSVSNATVGGFNLSGSLTETGNVYYVVVADGASAPTATQVIAGQTATGSSATASGSQVLGSSPFNFSFTLAGLAASTAYDVYVVARDSAGNNTVSVVKVDATTTSAGTAPTLSATGSNPVFIGGMAGSIDLFSGVSANTNDSGQTFSSLTLTVSNATDSGEFINVGGNNISLSANNSGTLTGIGSYSVTRSGNTVTLQLSGMSASNSEIAGLVDGLRYGNTSATATAATRAVTLSAVSDNGSSNNSTALSLTSTVNVLASNSALYVTAGDDTGDNATFGSSVQQDANDGGGLSLREALYWANNTAGIDRIVFQTDVTLASSLLSPTDSMLIDGQSFTLNGGGYSGFQIVTGSITLAIQNLTLTNFTTDYSTDTGGVFGISYSASDVNFRLYNVDISGNRDTMFGNGVFDLFNIAPGSYNFDFDRVNIHDNLMIGNLNEGVIRLFVSSTQQTVSLSITNSAITNNTGINPAGSTFGISGLWLTGNQGNPTSTHISLINTTITGQDNGIVFEFINNALSWVASVRNSIITGTSQDIVAYTPTGQPSGGSYTLYGGNNILSGSVNQVSSTDPRLAATASNAINQGNRFYVTGETDVRGLDRVRQGAVDIGAYESQFAAGTAPQVDLNGSTTGNNYSTTVPAASAATGISVTDALATLSQTDGDSRLWTLTLNLAGTTDGSSESLSLSRQALLAAHAAGINVTGNGSQTLTLTGGATQEAFQIALRAIVYANVAATPTAGNRTVSVTANDDASSAATSTLTLTASNNASPVVSGTIAAQSIAQGGSLNVTVPAGTFTDPDGDTLTLSATLADGTALPAWLSFNPATGTFSGTPANGDVGSLTIKVTATDGSNASVSTTFGLTVTNVNDAPVVATPIPAQSVAQDGSLSFTVPAGTFTDPDGDTLTLSATLADGTALPAWLSFNPATGTFSGTPANGDVDSLTIKVTATDGSSASVSTTFGLTVTNVNDAPVVATPIPAQSVAQDGSLSFTVPAGTFTDPDGDTLTLSATLADGTALPAWLSFNPATGTFSGTPANGDVGSLTIKVTATDGSNASVSTTFGLTVTNVNDAPVVSGTIAAQSIAQGGSLSVTVPAGTFTDPDGDTLTLSATLADGTALPSWLSFNPATGTFSGTPANGDVGSLTIKVTATDGSNASVSTTFGLTVTNVNDAPVVSGTIAAQSIAQGGSLNVTVPAGTFTDPDGDTLTLSATLADGTALPAWLSFNPATGTFSGTPASGDIGNLTIKVTATDGSSASVSTTFSLTVTTVNEAPVVSGTIAAQSIAQGGNLNVTIPAGTFTDPDGDTLTLSATLADGTALPAWLSFNPATGTFSGTPANGDVGSLTIKVTATDGSNASVSTTFGLTVTNVNDAPVVSGTIPAQNIAQGGSLNITVPADTFTDPDGDTLTLSATLADGTALPAWLSFNPATGTFSGTPANGDVGSLTIKVTATDGSNASVSTTFGLTVTNVNDAPVVSGTIAAQSIAQGGSLSVTVPAGTFTDPDGDTLTLSATLADGTALPAWLSFNPATGTFSGTPANGDVDSLTIKVTATDGSSASVSTTFGLTVTNVNDAPVVATPIPAQSVAQDGSLSFTVPAGTFTDPDGDTLTLSATLADGTALPAWLSFNPATGTFSGTPANGDVGSLTIKVTATDGSNASVSTTFGLTVTNVNDAPVVSGTIAAQSIAQGGSLSVTVPAGTFTDPDGDTLTLSATLADGTALPSWLSFNPATGTFSGTPANGDVGSLTIKVTATDGSNASVSTTFGLTVTNVNDAPVVSGTIAAQSIAQGGSLNVTVPAGTFTDPDGDTLTLSATLADGTALPAWLSFNPATGTFSGTPASGDIGNLTIKVTATDGSSASVSTTFSLTVTTVNEAPVVSGTIAAQSIAQGGNLNVTIPAGTFTDPDGDTLTLSATLADGTALPAWLSFNPATGTFSGTPANGDVGSLTIKVTATDGSNASVSTTFGLTVTNVNDAPVVSGTIPAQNIAQGGSLNITVPADTFTDPDGDTLTLSATLADGTALPSWLSFNPATGTFSGTPANGDVGSLTIKVTATDGSNASISTTFGLTVTNVNDTPVVSTPIPPQNVAQGGGFNFTVPDGTFSDPDGDTLTLSATLANGSPLPSWLRFDPTIGTFSGTPGNADVGTLVIRVTATDGSNTSISTSFGLTVTNANDAPVVATPIPPQSVAQGGGFNFTVPDGTFSDPDGDTLTLSATLANGSPLPSWLRFDPTIGTFSGTPGNADVGTLVIRVTATDGSNTSISTSFGLTVTNVNDAPVVATPIPPQNVTQGGGFNFTVPDGTFSDPDGDTLTLSATLANGSPLPSWLRFDPTIGTFSGTPGNADAGTLVIRVTATDGSNTSISTSFGLTVTNVNDVPVVATPIPPQNVAQGGGFNFTVPDGTFSDPDGDTLTLSATLANGSPLPSWLRFDPTIGTFSGTPGNADVGTLVIRVTATDGSNTSISTSFGLTVTSSFVSSDPQFKANDGIGRTPSASDTRQLFTQDATVALPALDGLIANPSLGSFTVGNDGAPKSVMSAIFATGRQNTEGGTLPTSQMAGTFGRGAASGIGINFDSTLGSFPSFSKDPALGGTSSLASTFSGIYLPSLKPMEVFSGGSWKDIPLDGANNAMNSTDDGTGRSVAFTPSLHQQLQQIGDSKQQRLAAIEQALQESGQQQG